MALLPLPTTEPPTNAPSPGSTDATATAPLPGSSATESLLPGSEDRAGMAKLASNYAIFLSRVKGDNAEAHTLHRRYDFHTHTIAPETITSHHIQDIKCHPT